MTKLTIDKKDKDALDYVCALADVKAYYHEVVVGFSDNPVPIIESPLLTVYIDYDDPAVLFQIGRMLETRIQQMELKTKICTYQNLNAKI